ncbi:Pyruvate carboxylase [Lasiodiplodia theobromae]|uniref:Pyruvate carboxylase n=1 Tax=Lasiodiplodia theobromae TaxID=45133 RepID=A0A5N5DAX7_9PEZI|nr:Pyruvate carboxylase [Lasiodiplodia theobromae]
MEGEMERERKGEGSGFAVWEEAAGGGGGGGKGDVVAGLGGGGSGSTVLFRKGDAWNVTLEPRSDEKGKGGKPSSSSAAAAPTHHLELTRVLRNDFPSSLSAEVVFASNATAAGPNASQSSSSTPYVMHLAATTTSSNAALSQHRRGRPDDPSHVCIPFAGKVVEVLVDEGDIVKEGDVICVVQQMKMELEVRSARTGRVTWVFEGEEGDEISEGTLACVLELEGKEKARL